MNSNSVEKDFQGALEVSQKQLRKEMSEVVWRSKEIEDLQKTVAVLTAANQTLSSKVRRFDQYLEGVELQLRTRKLSEDVRPPKGPSPSAPPDVQSSGAVVQFQRKPGWPQVQIDFNTPWFKAVGLGEYQCLLCSKR